MVILNTVKLNLAGALPKILISNVALSPEVQ